MLIRMLKIVGSIGLLCLVSCRPDSYDLPIKARVVVFENGSYKEKVVTYSYLTNPISMDGAIAKMQAGAQLDGGITQEILLLDPKKIFYSFGLDPKPEFRVKDGVIEPLNFDTLAMLSSYYQYEKIYDYWVKFGLKASDIGKVSIYVNPDIRATDGNSNVSLTIRLNAAFIPQVGDFLLFKTSRLEKLPFKMNAFILGHEFGHKIFDITFADRKLTTYETKSKDNTTQLDGMNEGSADFFGHTFTGEVDGMGPSFPSESKYRKLPVTWTTKTLLQEGERVCKGKFYCKGSVLASSLYEISLLSGLDREAVARLLIDGLTGLRDDWNAHKEESSFDYYYLLRRIQKGVPDALKASSCQIFRKWFDDTTNLNGLGASCEG